jgi:uncharacterized membrane protein YcaP (DUF421 family)
VSFESWSEIVRVITAALVAYAVLIAMLRLSGERTLAKVNAFDLVITVSLGSTPATVVLSSDAALAEGGVALVLLVMLQLVAAWLATRSALMPKPWRPTAPSVSSPTGSWAWAVP